MTTKKEWQNLKKKQRLLNQASNILRVENKDLPRIIERFQNEIKEMKQKLKK